MSRTPVYRTAAVWLLLAGGLCLAAARPARALERAASSWQLPATPPAASAQLELPTCFAVDYSTLELELFDDLKDEQLDRHGLLTSAFIASGVSNVETLTRYEAVFEAFIERRVAEGFADLPPEERAAALLESLHRELLSDGYGRECTDLVAVLDQGRFNCVSATILWQCLAQRFGLESTAAELPGHMNARLWLAGGMVEVETTCPHWFSLADDPAGRRQAVAMVRGQAGEGTGDPRPLDAAGVLAAIYYNRGIDLLEASRYAEAVAANAKAHRLDPGSAIARGNLLASLNNWALWLAAQEDHGRACQLLAAARGMAPEHGPFQVNYVAVHQQWIDALVATGELGQARQIADRLLEEMPQQRFFRRVRDEIDRQSGKL